MCCVVGGGGGGGSFGDCGDDDRDDDRDDRDDRDEGSKEEDVGEGEKVMMIATTMTTVMSFLMNILHMC